MLAATEAVKPSLGEAVGVAIAAGGGGALPNRIGLVFGVFRSAGLSSLIVELAAVGPAGLNTAARVGSLTSSFMSELLSALLTNVCKILTT